MKNKIFNLHLFIDAIKQLKIIGLTSLIILCLEAIIIPIGAYFSYKNAENTNIFPESTTFLETHFLLVFSFIVIAPLLTLYLFNFVNKRNASDFFHSIPHSRISIFLSYFSAIVTWLLLIIVGSSLLSIIASLFMRAYYVINIASIFITIFNMIAGSLFVAACVALAMCVTGTLFNNVIISGMIIFVPRMILTVILNAVASSLPLISADSFIPVLDAKYNVVSGFIFSILGFCTNNSFTEPLVNISSGLYTFVVAILITCLATWLFAKRKSESAGYSAPNRILQATFRLVIALIICLIPIYMMFQDMINDVPPTASTVFEYFIVYLIAIAAYFIYELITTRKFSNLIKSVPALLVLVLINIGILLSMLGLFNKVVNYTPDADDIESVQILSYNNNNYYYEDPLAYFTQASEKINLNNDKINQIVSTSLKSSYDMINESLANYIYAYNNGIVKTVAIKSGGHTYYRNIMLSANEATTISKELGTIKEYKEVYQDLPAIGENNTTVSLSNASLSKESIATIYNTFTKEIAAMEFKDWYAYLNKNNYDQNSLDTLTITSTIGMESYSASIPITTELAQTCNSYFQEVSLDSRLDEVIRLLKNPSGNVHFSVDMIPFNFDTDEIQNVISLFWYNEKETNLNTMKDDDLTTLLSIFEKYSNATPSVDSKFIKLSVWIGNYNENVTDNFTLFLQITDSEDILTIDRIFENIYK